MDSDGNKSADDTSHGNEIEFGKPTLFATRGKYTLRQRNDENRTRIVAALLYLRNHGVNRSGDKVNHNRNIFQSIY